jgi:hypothetical protein
VWAHSSRPVAPSLRILRSRDITAVACAFSAGVHASLVPEHLHEAPRLGVAFAGASAVLIVLAVALLRWPRSLWPPAGAALLLAALIAGYALSRTSGIAPLGAEREPIDALGVATKVVEVVGLAAAMSCFRARTPRRLRLVGRHT